MITHKSPRAILDRLDQLVRLQEASLTNDSYWKNETQSLVEELVTLTRIAYDSIAGQYREVRKDEPHEVDKRLFDKLIGMARELVGQGRLGNSQGILSLLDVGTGPGRDLCYFTRFKDIKAIGIDNSDSFIAILSSLADQGLIAQDSFRKMDMRDLFGFVSETFDIVRHNATLLHLPLVTLGIGADQAVAESYRVLVNNGILFVSVKAGQGMELHDTGEGLGGRFFQYYSRDSLGELLSRSKFKVLEIENWREERPSDTVNWLAAYAQK
jgi:SAM-dependent methyltransferase